MRGLIAARTAVMTAVAAIDTDMRRMTRGSAACRRLMTIPGVGQLTALAFVAAIDDPSRIRRSRDVGAYLGLGSKAASVWRDRLRRQHLEVRRSAGADPPVRSRQCHADPLQGPAQTQGLGLRDRQKINDAQSASRSGAPPRYHHACDAARRNGVRTRPKPAHETGSRNQLPRGATPKGGSRRRRGLCSRAYLWPTAISTEPRCTQLTPSSAERARRERRHPEGVDSERRASALDPLENAGIPRRRQRRRASPLTH